jgi:hypothetical protein
MRRNPTGFGSTGHGNAGLIHLWSLSGNSKFASLAQILEIYVPESRKRRAAILVRNADLMQNGPQCGFSQG